MSSSEIAETIALKIFEVYSPTPLSWRIGREIMLRLSRSLADYRYIVTDVGWQCIYVLRIPGIILRLLGCRRQLARK